MKKLLYTIAAALLLCACGTKQTESQCPYQEDSFPIHGSVLKNVDSMEYYNSKAAEGDTRPVYHGCILLLRRTSSTFASMDHSHSYPARSRFIIKSRC